MRLLNKQHLKRLTFPYVLMLQQLAIITANRKSSNYSKSASLFTNFFFFCFSFICSYFFQAKVKKKVNSKSEKKLRK